MHLDPRALLREGDEELNGLFSRSAVLEMVDENPERSCKDCVEFIKQQDPEKKMKSLIKAMQDAEARGDSAAIERLTEEQNRLGKRPGRLHGRRVPGM